MISKLGEILFNAFSYAPLSIVPSVPITPTTPFLVVVIAALLQGE